MECSVFLLQAKRHVCSGDCVYTLQTHYSLQLYTVYALPTDMGVYHTLYVMHVQC